MSVRHLRAIAVLDQLQLGSCTGNATVGCLGTAPFYDTVKNNGMVFDEKLAVKVYSLGTQLDSVSGTYPPTDTGSTGIGVAKAAMQMGLISGYTHTFSFDDTLKALSTQPVIIGVNWYNGFFEPDADGIISIAANDTIAGGHEFVLDEIDVERQLVGATNSWGESWGLNGRFYIPFALLKRLLNEDGDVTVFTPINQPAPIPTPVPPSPGPVNPVPVPTDADAVLWNSVSSWAHGRHTGSNEKAAKAVLSWAKSKGLTG